MPTAWAAEVGGCGEQELNGELKGPGDNRAPFRWFKGFCPKDYLEMMGWG